MKLIQRKPYLQKLIDVSNTPDIKVISGIRRCGKSKLLNQFQNYLSNKKVNIIHIDFNNSKFEKLAEYHKFEEFVESKWISDKDNFLLVDEVQMCQGFEKALNSLHSKEKFQIYVTGSNAFLLSSDLATLFTGRVFEIKLYPFSFKEFKKYFNESNNFLAFDRYLNYGGMSGSYLYLNESERKDYLVDIYKTLIMRDIVQKFRIRNKVLIEKLTNYLVDNISNLTSIRNIEKTLISNRQKVNHETIGSYINYLANSYFFYKVKRYDIKGKKYLYSTDKYYLCDHAFKYALLGNKNADTGRILENIVAINLIRNGYELYTGILYKKEVDFVAIKEGIKFYIQVSDDISNKSTLERELSPLLSIKDGYQKIIVARTKSETYQIDGVYIIDIANWLNSESFI